MEGFPLASDPDALRHRSRARELSEQAAGKARALNCELSWRAASDMALWLTLVDPDEAAIGRERLVALLSKDD